MAKKSYPTINAAQRLIQKVIETRAKGSPDMNGGNRVYPVASLSGGRLLLSSGEIRQKPVIQNLRDIKEKQTFEGGRQSPAEYLSELSFNIAVPQNQTGQGSAERAQAFAKYLSSVLNPTLSAPPEMGLPALLPDMPQGGVSTFQLPSAIANLPKMAPKVDDVERPSMDIINDLSKGLEDFKESLRQEFRKRAYGGENAAVMSQVQGNIPLVRNYGQSYALPSSESASYAKISGNPFGLMDRVR